MKTAAIATPAQAVARPTGAAAALLEAHVQFIAAQIDGEALRPRIEREVDALLADAALLKLDEVVSRASIKDVIRIYASELELAGGIPELVAEIARELHGASIHARTRLGDLLSDRQFAELVDKFLEMKPLRDRLLEQLADNPASATLASDLLYRGIKGYLAQSRLTQNIPGARSVMKLGKQMIQRASPGLEASLEEGLKSYVRKNIGATLKETQRFLSYRLDDAKLREGALDVWDRVKSRRLAEILGYLEADDAEDFFVIAYEWWRSLRHGEWYSTVIGIGVDHFFDKYGKTTLTGLLEEIGIGREHLVADAMRFAPPVIRALKKKKLLEPLIRRNLEDFYLSAAVAEILNR